MKATSTRRQVIVAILLALALAGAALRHWAENPSITRDVGTLLLVLWLPAVGNIVAFAVSRYRRRRSTTLAFTEGSFAPHLEVELMPGTATQPLAPGHTGCTLLLGTEGFTARLGTPLAGWLASGQAQAIELEFLRPALALPRFGAGTAFQVLAGPVVVGQGRVLRVL
ncbi:MAG: hypothetical protein JWQ07_2226 [Ramlibacter sp.]|nr:hypothetical protein [Ramlibacter sp.]